MNNKIKNFNYVVYIVKKLDRPKMLIVKNETIE